MRGKADEPGHAGALCLPQPGERAIGRQHPVDVATAEAVHVGDVDVIGSEVLQRSGQGGERLRRTVDRHLGCDDHLVAAFRQH